MSPGAGWYPVKLKLRSDGETVLDWQELSAVPFTDPFFEDSLRRAKHGKAGLRQTTLQSPTLGSLAPFIAPSAFIFHASRSGSTLLTQLLTCIDGTLAISEPPIVDEVLRFSQEREEKLALFRYVVCTYAQRRSGAERYFLLKHDSWHVRWFPLIREAFPDTPCLFVYRHPVEILWSHFRQRGSQMVPGLRDAWLFDMSPGSVDPANLDAYATRVLESIFTKALPFVNEGGLLPIAYHELVQDPMECIRRMGVVLSAAEQERIEARCRFHSKKTGEAYRAEIEKAIPAATRLRLEELSAPVLIPCYDALESLRARAQAETSV